MVKKPKQDEEVPVANNPELRDWMAEKLNESGIPFNKYRQDVESTSKRVYGKVKSSTITDPNDKFDPEVTKKDPPPWSNDYGNAVAFLNIGVGFSLDYAKLLLSEFYKFRTENSSNLYSDIFVSPIQLNLAVTSYNKYWFARPGMAVYFYAGKKTLSYSDLGQYISSAFTEPKVSAFMYGLADGQAEKMGYNRKMFCSVGGLEERFKEIFDSFILRKSIFMKGFMERIECTEIKKPVNFVDERVNANIDFYNSAKKIINMVN